MALLVLALALVTSTALVGAAASDVSVVRWAGTVTMPRGIADAVPMNMTVKLARGAAGVGVPGRAPSSGTAATSWVFDRNNKGQPCVPHSETGLLWNETSGGGAAAAVASGVGDDFYSLRGIITTDGTGRDHFDGNLTAAHGVRGHFHLSRAAPRVPSRCRAPPPPPQPQPRGGAANSTLWPAPRRFARRGTQSMWVDAASFKFVLAGGAAGSAGLHNAVVRHRALCFPHVAPEPPPRRAAGLGAEVEPLRVITVHVAQPDARLAYGVDESYNLTLSPGMPGTITAATVFGAYHALESFTQLLQFDFDAAAYRITGTVPLRIEDAPRFAWRELMVDTARHFLPVRVLEEVVDSMTTAKLNVLHLHLVDSQAFPLHLPSAPLLSKGAHSREERYSLGDLGGLQAYAEARGIRVVAEIDTPGHGAAWCAGMPGICPSMSCLEPLDPSTNTTFAAIRSVLEDLFTVFPDGFVHLGGDEVSTHCWNTTAHVVDWMRSRGLTLDAAYGYFAARTHAMARALGRQVVVWDEIWDHFGTSLDRASTVINTRFNPGQAPARQMCVANATANGYRVVRSENVHWYLDKTVGKDWTAQYSFDLCGDLNASSCQHVIGGAASMWGETVDTSDLMRTVWPRAGAVGEKLWSPQNASNSSALALPRYVAYRCYLNRRGFAAAPARCCHV